MTAAGPRRPPRVVDSAVFPNVDACPACGGEVRSASMVDLSVFICLSCGACWHVELGVVYQVAPPPDAAHS